MFEILLSYLNVLFYIIIFISIYIFIKGSITKYSFNMLNMFILTFTLFYFIVPFIQTIFKNYRNNTSLFTQILNTLSDGEILFNLLLAICCLMIVIFSYHLKFNKKKKVKIFFNKRDNGKLYKKILVIADFFLIIGVISIFLLIVEVGSIKTYLSLGALTRGIDKDPTMYIRSSYLQLITLSLVILVTPYLYTYLFRLKKNKSILIRLIISLIFSILFLLYNQGRAPLLLFFLPFLFTISKKQNKKGIFSFGILFIIGISLLNYLDGLFKYLSYGVYSVKEGSNFITEFLGEFSYPFTNFALREQLVDFVGFRYMYDYIIWPFTMIPSSLLGLINVSKESLISISIFNTEAYGYFLNVTPDGGIPVDFLTFNFYQYGYISLVINCFIVGLVLRKLDEIFYFYKNSLPIKIILFRISFTLINIMNNADISAIVRNRLDVVILLLILIYIYIKDKKSMKTVS